MVGALLAAFYVIDSNVQWTPSTEDSVGHGDHGSFGPTVSLYGAVNLLYVGKIQGSIVLHKELNEWMHHTFGFEGPWRELIMAAAACSSLVTTPRRVHVENHFNYAPIREVALLFVGIFATMLPALNYVAHASGSGDRRGPLQSATAYYYSAGLLSAVLDNAPTYLTFFKSHLVSIEDVLVKRALEVVKRPGVDITPDDLTGLSEAQQQDLRKAIAALVRYHDQRVSTGALSMEEVRVGFLLGNPANNRILVAISMAAVLFGACTYIGNGPNFMVKAIAEHSGAPAPGFFAYVVRYTIPVLLPILIGVWALFLR